LGVLVDLGIFVVNSGERVVENEVCELLVKGTILTHFTFEVWNEIIGLVVIYLLGVFIRGPLYEFRKNYFCNDSWRRKKWK
jgi:hypothetical protein